MNFIESHAIPIAMSAADVKNATLEDDTLQRVIENLLKGRWNEHSGKVDIDTLKALKKFQCELMVTSGGLLLNGTKLIIPKKLQCELTVTRGGRLLKGTKLIIPKKLQDRDVELAHRNRTRNLRKCQSYRMDDGKTSQLTSVVHSHQATTCWSQ